MADQARIPLEPFFEQGTDFDGTPGLSTLSGMALWVPPQRQTPGCLRIRRQWVPFTGCQGILVKLSLADEEHSIGVGVDVCLKRSQGAELQAFFGLQREGECFVDLLEERNRIYRGHPGVSQPGIEIRIGTKAQVLVGKLRETVFLLTPFELSPLVNVGRA